ncbi:MAG: hypothetical protein ACRCZI_08495 [Cetobacterium sp.]
MSDTKTLIKEIIIACDNYKKILHHTGEVLEKQLLIEELSGEIDQNSFTNILNLLSSNCITHNKVIVNAQNIVDYQQMINNSIQEILNINNELNTEIVHQNQSSQTEYITDIQKIQFDEQLKESQKADIKNESGNSKDTINNIERTNLKSDTDICEHTGIMNEYDRLMEKRKQLHKDLGTYEADKDIEIKIDNDVNDINETLDKMTITDSSIEKGINVDNLPIANALHKLDWNEQEKLQKSIFKKALFNVENILQIGRSDPNFKQEVKEESDRLLNVWKNSN